MTSEEYKKIVDELIDMLDEGVYIVDSEGIGIHYNAAMAESERVNYEDVKGKKFHEAFPDFKIGESTIYKALKSNIVTETQQQNYKNLYGKEIVTVNSTRPIIVNGKTVAAVEVSKNITDIKEMSERLLSMGEGKPTDSERTSTSHGIKRYTFDDIFGKSVLFEEAKQKAKRASENNASVFIYGETGTGKELFAQSIHYEGKRKQKPFLAQNCAAIPATLLEGILFGTTKGSFTGAVDRAGLFEQANGGTLLLDEVSAMPYDLQSKLLRVLQESYIRRIGGTKDIPIDVRIIATVNERPEKLIEEGKLRKDLYYRLNVVNISIPALRDRKDDIAGLVEKFLEKYNKKYDKEVWMTSDGALKKLMAYDFPGNVRELENIVEQAVSLSDKDHVLTEKALSLPKTRNVKTRSTDGSLYDYSIPLDEYLEGEEKRLITSAMAEEKENISRAADRLGIKRQTLQHKLKKYGIT